MTIFNEEFLVSASHQLALITSLPFVHTARRYYRLNGLVRSSDWSGGGFTVASRCREDDQTWSFRGSKSRNKVSVGEPAEGSLSYRHDYACVCTSSCVSAAITLSIWCIAFFTAWRFQLCVCIRVVVSATNPSSAHQNLVGYLKHIKRSLNVKV